MRIAIMGAGAIGGYFGARLAQAGEEVIFVARGAHLDAMAQSGLSILSEKGDFSLDSVTAVEDTAGVGPVDVILFCVKLYDTEDAARACLGLMGPETFIVSLQNGVESVAMISAVVGPGRVLGGAAYIVASIQSPGVIIHKGLSDFIEFGEPARASGTPDPGRRAAAFAAACEGAGIQATVAGDMDELLWRKFVLLAASSALTSITRKTIGEICADPDLRRTMIVAIAETAAVGRALGVDLEEEVEATVLDAFDHVIAYDAKASQLVDLERGRKLELEWTSGAVHRLGLICGVATPFHTEVFETLKPFAMGGQKS